MPTATSLLTVQRAYIAYYGRPADPEGLDYWANRLDTEQGGFNALIEQFGTSAEASALFGALSNSEAIETLYQQILGRSADPTGLQFYEQKLISGEMTKVSIAQNILDGVDPADPLDGALLNHRIQVAQRFTDALDTEAEQAAYSGNTAIQLTRAMLSQVDEATSVENFNIQTVISALLDEQGPDPVEPVDITVNGPGVHDASQGVTHYSVSEGNYSFEIKQFSDDDILQLFDEAAISVINMSASDGEVVLQVADAASSSVSEIVLTGLDTSTDGSIYNLASLNSAFGDSILF